MKKISMNVQVISPQNQKRKILSRRQFVKTSAAAALAAQAIRLPASLEATDGSGTQPTEIQLKEVIKPLLMKRSEVKAWLDRSDFPFARFDAELGYVHTDRDVQEGLDGAICHYRYEKSGARKLIAHADKACRINTYGNSFTACEQVSDGETWQEYLAAHLGEPIRNFGVGGYSVYQAYRRMLHDEAKFSAEYIIFNIFDDDHYRNLHGWRRFKFGAGGIAANGPVPHVAVDPDENRFVEHSNPCPTEESLYALCELESAYQLFKDDYSLIRRTDRALARKAGKRVPTMDYDDEEFTRRGIWATMRIVELVEKFAAEHNKKVLYVLSYGGYTVQQFIETGRRFDQTLADYFKDRQLPHVDLMTAHAEDYTKFQCSMAEYLKRYYVGHYHPGGNLFQALAMKDRLVEMLSPKPPAYLKD